jgi:hypothetical protein
MTQAFNLAQFANFLNSSGQVSASGLQSGIATQWVTSGSNIYFSNKIAVGTTTISSNHYVNINQQNDVSQGGIILTAINAQTQSSAPGQIGNIYFRSNTGFANNGAQVAMHLSRRTYATAAGTGNDVTDQVGLWIRGYYDNTGTGTPIYLGGYGFSGDTPAVIIDQSNNLSFNSGYGSPALAYGCRSWVNFNGTTTPPNIRGSANVSSVTRTGTGFFVVTMSTAMPDANYSVVVSGNAIGASYATDLSGTPTTTQYGINTTFPNVGQTNASVYTAAVFR